MAPDLENKIQDAKLNIIYYQILSSYNLKKIQLTLASSSCNGIQFSLPELLTQRHFTNVGY